MLRDTRDKRSFETQIIDAVRSVNRALGGTYGTSSAIYKSEFNQYEVQLIDAIKGIGTTLKSSGLSGLAVSGDGGGGYSTVYIGTTKGQRSAAPQALTGITTLDASGLATILGGVSLGGTYNNGTASVDSQLVWDADASAWHLIGNFYADGYVSAGGVPGGGSGISLGSLSDVTISSPSNGQALIYRNGNWVNETISGGGDTVTVANTKNSGSTIATITVTGSTTTVYTVKNYVSFQQYDDTAKTVKLNASGQQYTLCVDGYGGGGGGGTSYSAGTGIDITSNTISLKVATTSAIGGIRLGYSQSGNNYPVEIDSNNKAYVTVPGGGGGGGGGSVSSVGISALPSSVFSVSNSPITTSGTIDIGLKNQSANLVLASPSNATGTPTFRALVKADLPSLYVGKTVVKGTNTTNDTLIGINGFTTAASATASGDTSLVEWDSNEGAWHFHGNLYADGFVSAGGVAGANQTITGNKVFSGAITFDGSDLSQGQYCITADFPVKFNDKLDISGAINISGVSISGSSTKLSVSKNAEFSGISNVTGNKVTIQAIADQIIALGGSL